MQAAAEIEWEMRDMSGALKLSGVVDIFEAENLRGVALEAASAIAGEAVCAEAAAHVLLDLTNVERLDVSAVQLLCAFRQAITAGGRSVRVLPMPDNVARSLATLGVTL